MNSITNQRSYTTLSLHWPNQGVGKRDGGTVNTIVMAYAAPRWRFLGERAASEGSADRGGAGKPAQEGDIARTTRSP